MAAIAIAAAGLVWFGAPADAATTRAAIIDFAYQEGECGSSSGDGNYSIAVGDTVTWVNCGNEAHTVTGTGFGDTNDLPPGAAYARTFNTPGTFPYYCDNHPSMRGSVTVAGEPTPTTLTPAPTAPATTATTARPTTTTTTTTPAPTTTSEIDAVFGSEPTSSTTSTTGDPTVTTRALGEGGDGGTSAGLVALLILALGGVATAVTLLIRRLRTPGEPPIT